MILPQEPLEIIHIAFLLGVIIWVFTIGRKHLKKNSNYKIKNND